MVTQDALDFWLEEQPNHGPADVAAAIGYVAWFDRDVAGLVDSVANPLWQRYAGQDNTAPAGSLAFTLQGLLADAAAMGARLGFALGSVAGEAAKGWPAWATAAEQLLAGAGCGDRPHDHDLRQTLRELATAAGAPS